jgi:hypothetical protein
VCVRACARACACVCMCVHVFMLGGGHGTARRGWGVYYRLSSVYYRIELGPRFTGLRIRGLYGCVCLLLQDLVQSCLHGGGGGYGRTCATRDDEPVVSIKHLVISYVCLSLLTFFKMLSTPTRFTCAHVRQRVSALVSESVWRLDCARAFCFERGSGGARMPRNIV